MWSTVEPSAFFVVRLAPARSSTPMQLEVSEYALQSWHSLRSFAAAATSAELSIPSKLGSAATAASNTGHAAGGILGG